MEMEINNMFGGRSYTVQWEICGPEELDKVQLEDLAVIGETKQDVENIIYGPNATKYIGNIKGISIHEPHYTICYGYQATKQGNFVAILKRYEIN